MLQLVSACPTSPTPFSVKPIGASARCIDGLSCALNLFQRQLQLRKLLSLLGDHLQPGSQPGSPRPTPGGQVGAQPCLPAGAQHSPRGIEASTFLAVFQHSCGRQIELWVSPRKSDPMHARMASSPRLAHHHVCRSIAGVCCFVCSKQRKPNLYLNLRLTRQFKYRFGYFDVIQRNKQNTLVVPNVFERR
jgi:hypothetical protein